MLVVIEGPDNVGKTSISQRLSTLLQTTGISCEALSFPGNKEGTLGKFIHEFHHKHDKYGIEELPSTSLQLLHVAAHFDTIERDIIPALEQKDIVILDRFWWSTYVYGKVGGIKPEVLDMIMKIEDLGWDGLKPEVVFFIDNDKPFGSKRTEKWKKLRDEYKKLVDKQSKTQNIIHLINGESLEKTTQKIIGILDLN